MKASTSEDKFYLVSRAGLGWYLPEHGLGPLPQHRLSTRQHGFCKGGGGAKSEVEVYLTLNTSL